MQNRRSFRLSLVLIRQIKTPPARKASASRIIPTAATPVSYTHLVIAYGRVEYDTYTRELVFMPDVIEKIEEKKRHDIADEKRVELHVHTKLSEMDGVCDIEEFIAPVSYTHLDVYKRQQRILVAQALLGKPRLLLFDEPTAGLDPKERVSLRNVFQALGKDHILLIATHVVSDVETIVKEVIFLKKGKVIDPDDVAAMIERTAPAATLEEVYLHLFEEEAVQ